MDQWQGGLWELFKVVAPLLTGGLAGSMLTYLLNQRALRRKVPRLLMNVENVNYALSSRDENFTELRVSYKSIEYENLALYSARLRNISDKSVTNSPFLIKMSANTSIVDQNMITIPISKPQSISSQNDSNTSYIWNSGELKPGDSAEIQLLLSPAVDVEWLWRGDDDVEVTSVGKEISINFDRELRNIIAWVAAFVFLGGFPVFQGIVQGIFIFVTAPFLISYFIRFRSLLRSRRETPFNISLGHSSNVTIETGGNISMASRSFSDDRNGREHK